MKQEKYFVQRQMGKSTAMSYATKVGNLKLFERVKEVIMIRVISYGMLLSGARYVKQILF